MHKPYWYIKRILDLLLALVLFLPALAIVSLCYVLIKLETSGPAFFVQKRPGYKGKLFKIYKLRTMKVETHQDGRLISNLDRLTNVGKIIRSLSLDELPQIWNVIRGEMSFIGPRPLLPEYLPLYSKEQMRRHDVLPGISGWAQVNGRNAIRWREKFECDLEYVNNISFLFDIRILFMSIFHLFKRSGINSDQKTTMERFTGLN